MKLFVIVSRVPWPLEKGDKLRIFHQIRELNREHEVTLCCLNDARLHPDARKQLEAHCDRLEIFDLPRWRIRLNLLLALFSRKPFQVHYFYQRSVHNRIKALIQEVKPDHIYCQLVRAAEYVKEEHDIRKTIDYMDTFSKGMERRIHKSAVWMKPFVRAEYRRLQAYENIIFEYFDHKTIISEQDRDLIFHPQQKEIEVVPNGVDTDHFAPRKAAAAYEMVFIGNMSYVPNVETARYLATELLPAVQKKHPQARLLLAGASPTAAVKALVSESVTVSGWVEDIRDAYANGQIFVAPMRIGTGLQNKLLEAMSMEIPCITSPLANNALGATDEQHLLVGNNTEEWAKLVDQLLTEPETAQRLGRAGRQFVVSEFNWEATTAGLARLMKGN